MKIIRHFWHELSQYFAYYKRNHKITTIVPNKAIVKPRERHGVGSSVQLHLKTMKSIMCLIDEPCNIEDFRVETDMFGNALYYSILSE